MASEKISAGEPSRDASETLLHRLPPQRGIHSARVCAPPGLLARTLLGLEAGGCDDLISQTREVLHREHSQAYWDVLPELSPDDEAIREQLLSAGRYALEELLAQQSGGLVS